MTPVAAVVLQSGMRVIFFFFFFLQVWVGAEGKEGLTSWCSRASHGGDPAPASIQAAGNLSTFFDYC